MMIELSIQLSSSTSLAQLKDVLFSRTDVKITGYVFWRELQTAVVRIWSEGAGPVNALCMALVEQELAETVLAQRIDA